MEPARFRVTLESEDGATITLVVTERGLATVLERLGEQRWRVADTDAEPAPPGRFSVSPAPLSRVDDVPIAGRRSVA